MGLFDKVKNLFTEEIEEEVEIEEEPIKKEMIQVEIPSPIKKRSEEEPKEEIKPVESKKEEYKFPFFDDDDFSALEKREEKKERREKKKSLYRGTSSEPKEVYSPPKEEKKIFKPTPIISPVYGILDKNYQKEDIKSKSSKPRSYYNPKEATVDEIRNKAYGTLEDDIETTLFGKEDVYEEPEVVINDSSTPRHGASEVIDKKEDDLTDLLENELSKENEKKGDGPRKISDSELFSMIDSMYQKGDKND